MRQWPIAYWIAFGPHGPRSLPPPDEGKKVALGVAVGILASLALFSTSRLFAKPAPHTMNKEWQEAANEYLKVRSPVLAFLRFKPLTAARYRSKKLIPLLVLPRPTTLARARSNLLLPRLNSHKQATAALYRKTSVSPLLPLEKKNKQRRKLFSLHGSQLHAVQNDSIF